MAENVTLVALTSAVSAVSLAEPATSSKRKRPYERRRMVYGFPVDHDECYEKAIAGGDSEAPGRTTVVMAYRFRMLRECRKHWRNANFRIVEIGQGRARNHVMCISLSENTSQNAMQRPPRVVVDKLKTILQTVDDPKWYRFVGA